MSLNQLTSGTPASKPWLDISCNQLDASHVECDTISVATGLTADGLTGDPNVSIIASAGTVSSSSSGNTTITSTAGTMSISSSGNNTVSSTAGNIAMQALAGTATTTCSGNCSLISLSGNVNLTGTNIVAAAEDINLNATVEVNVANNLKFSATSKGIWGKIGTGTVVADAVTINSYFGVITDSAIVGTGARNNITVTNSVCTVNSLIFVSYDAATITPNSAPLSLAVQANAGEFTLRVFNNSINNTSSPPTYNFMIINAS